MDTELNSPQDYFAVLKRRKWYVIIPVVVLSLVSAAVAFLLPPVYRSMGTILIEQPDIPPQLVASTITTYADERLQVIERKVTTSKNLLNIMNKYGLYQEERQYKPLSEVVEEMRDATGMELISAEGHRNDGPVTIAFEVSFDYDQAAMAQRVANELISLYLSENIRARQAKAAETTAFLAGEARRLESVIADLDNKLADLKQRYAGTLPEQMASVEQAMSRAENELRALDQREEALRQTKMFLETQLLQTEPYQAGADTGISLADRLRELRTELVSLSARYTPQHPTLVQLREEVAALEKAVGSGSDVAALRNERDKIQTDLALAQQKLSDQHPKVAALKARLERVEQQIFNKQRASGGLRDGVPADNPAYIQIEMQLAATKSELGTLDEQRAYLKSVIADYQQRMEQAPLVEAEYQRLMRAYDSAVNDHKLIKQKQVTAELGQTLETERKGERFSLIEPPQVPTEPIKPNRPMILTLGILLAVGAGIAAVVLAETMDTAIRGARQVAAITGIMPLVAIPYIRTQAEIRRMWRRRIGLAVGSLGVVAGLVVSVHLYISPLDVLWARLERHVESQVRPLARD